MENEKQDDPAWMDVEFVEEVKEEPMVVLTARERERWEAKIEMPTTPDGHWLWTASRNHKGYGQFKFRTDAIQTHRLSFLIHRGPIPAGLCVLHTCDVRKCVRPDHLFLGTNEDNVADRVAKDRTAKGDKNGSRLHPESRCRGDAHPTRTRPEEVLKIGEANPFAKLTEDNVREMRMQYDSGAETQTALGKRFGVSSMTVSNICRRKKWTRVK